jgi:hypothetical protein
MEQYEQFTQRMEATYPKLFSGRYGGFAIGEGWYPIVESLCGHIQSYIDQTHKPQVIVTQIKEKFGTLRFYCDNGDDVIYDMIQNAEKQSAKTCEKCGNAGARRTGGWLKTLCDHHESERQLTR